MVPIGVRSYFMAKYTLLVPLNLPDPLTDSWQSFIALIAVS